MGLAAWSLKGVSGCESTPMRDLIWVRFKLIGLFFWRKQAYPSFFVLFHLAVPVVGSPPPSEDLEKSQPGR
jgi:hypothetical protein